MIDSLAFSPCGNWLAVAGYHLACRVIDAHTGERKWTAKSNSGFGLSLAFTEDDRVLCRQNGVSIRDLHTGNELQHVSSWSQSFGLSPDGETAFVADGGFQDVVRQYHLESDEQIAEVELESGAMNRIAVSPNGDVVAIVGCKRFYLLTTDGLKEIVSVRERAFSNGAFALAFSPCGSLLVFSAGRVLFVWDVAAAREIQRMELESKYFMDATFTRDGQRLITVSKEGAARVWNAVTWECECSFDWQVGPLRAVGVSQDGTRAAVAGDEGRVVIWDLDL
jgi:WD40 repeat protein